VYYCTNTLVSLNFSISPASDIPIFRQIVEQVERAVTFGQLKTGDQLPAVRTLAEILVVKPNTVARSYQELIRSGVIESRQGRGVFVAERRQVFSEAERRRRLERAAEQLCHEGFLLGARLSEIREIVDSHWKKLQRQVQSIEPSDERKPK
jgi:GntR family transcriptional regulator